MIRNYIKIAFKVMLRQKFFTAVSLFGISFTIVIFSITAGFLQMLFGDNAPAVNKSRSLYFDDYQLLDVNNIPVYAQGDSILYSNLKKSEYVSEFCRYKRGSISSFKRGKAVTFAAYRTDDAIWRIYDYKFLEGRPYTANDIAEGQLYAVITASVRKFYFGESSAVGKYIGSSPRLQVIGVVEDALSVAPNGPEEALILQPYHFYQKESNAAVIMARSSSDLPYIKAELHGLARQSEVYKGMNAKGLVVRAQTVYEKNEFEKVILGFSAFLFFIMAIPALNMMGLNINRIAERSSEIGIRKAFGASSNVLAGQFITENMIITLIGGFLGVLLTMGSSSLILKVFYYNSPEEVAAMDHLLINWKIMGYTLFCIFFFGLLSGIVPAWRMSRLQAVEALKGGWR